MRAAPFLKAGGFGSIAILLAVLGGLYGGRRDTEKQRIAPVAAAPMQDAQTEEGTGPPVNLSATESAAPERGHSPSAESNIDPASGQALALAAILFQGNCARQLSRPAVQDRLGLSDKQRDQLAGLDDRVKEAQGDLRRRPISEMPLVLRNYEQAARDIGATIDKTLTELQLKQLYRAALNDVHGPVALLAPCVIQELKLDAGQIATIAALVWDDFERAKAASLWELPGLRQRTRDSRRRAEEQLNEAQRLMLPKLVQSDPN